MKTIRLFILSLLVSVSLSGCLALYGIKPNKNVQVNECLDEIQKWYPQSKVGVLDKAYFESFGSSANDSSCSPLASERLQPLSIHIYDRHQQVFFATNCYAGGFPNLKWERVGNFSEFPPLSLVQTMSNITETQHLKFAQLTNHKLDNQKRFVVVLHVTFNMKRQSKRLVRFITKELSERNDTEVIILHSPIFQMG